MKIIRSLLTVCLFGLLLAKAQSIKFTFVPPPGEGGTIQGIVEGVDPAQYKLALINDVFGSLWSKPTFAQPWVYINSDGTFSGRFVTGGQDACASLVHVLLVPIDYAVPLVAGGSQIPQDLIDAALVHEVAVRGGQDTVTWAGEIWSLKDTGICIWGPGPNFFSKDSVSVDDQGRLHLTIRYVDGAWRCAEIIMKRSSGETLGYGRYTVAVNSPLANLPDPIVFGVFTYDDDSAYTHREIDFLEFSNGAVVGRDSPYQVVIQPYQAVGQRFRYSSPEPLDRSFHVSTWLPGVVSFASYTNAPIFDRYRGEYNVLRAFYVISPLVYWDDIGDDARFVIDIPGSGEYIEPNLYGRSQELYYRARLNTLNHITDSTPFNEVTIKIGVPPVGNERVHLNLWLHNGLAPSDDTNDTFEVIVSDFRFEPLGNMSLFPSLKVTEFNEELMRIKLIVPAE